MTVDHVITHVLQVGTQGVQVYHAIEVNIVMAAMEKNQSNGLFVTQRERH